MDWKQYLKEVDGELATYAKALPGTMKGFALMGDAAKREGALETKTSEFVALGVAISSQCHGCIGYHVRNLYKLGASREEIVQVLSMCAYMAGGPGIMYGAKALKAWDALATG